MTAQELLLEARKAGFKFVPAPGGRFFCKTPKGADPTIKKLLEEKRQEILEELRKGLQQQAQKGQKLLAEKGRLLVRSHRLGRLIWIQTDEQTQPGMTHRVIFTISELKTLFEGLGPQGTQEILEAICLIKEELGGKVLEVRPLDQTPQLQSLG